jgi:hypothetical protein
MRPRLIEQQARRPDVKQEESEVGKYLVFCRSSVSVADQMANSDPEASQARMDLWPGGSVQPSPTWLHRCAASPLSPRPDRPSTPYLGGLSVLEADTVDQISGFAR